MTKNGDREQKGIPLSDMIETLRSELQLSLEKGKGQEVAFHLEKAELELKVAVSEKASGGLGIKLYVISGDAGDEKQRESAHTFKLTLKPVSGKTGGPIDISALVPGAEAPGRH